VQAPLTVALTAMEIGSPHDHGVGAARLNRHLDAYLATRV